MKSQAAGHLAARYFGRRSRADCSHTLSRGEPALAEKATAAQLDGLGARILQVKQRVG